MFKLLVLVVDRFPPARSGPLVSGKVFLAGGTPTRGVRIGALPTPAGARVPSGVRCFPTAAAPAARGARIAPALVLVVVVVEAPRLGANIDANPEDNSGTKFKGRSKLEVASQHTPPLIF